MPPRSATASPAWRAHRMSSSPRRLHPAAIVLGAVDALGQAAIPLVLAFVVGVGTGGPSPATALVYAAAGAALAVLAGFLRWRATRYRVTEGAVHLTQGLLSPDETVIPKHRIQAVDSAQGPIQRAFGVLELHVQTAGGGRSAEIVLSAMAPEDARALRAAVGHEETEHGDDERMRLGLGRLLVAAVTGPQLGVLLPVLAALGTIGDDLASEEVGRGALERLPDAPLQIAALVAGVAVAALALSVAGAVVAFSGFEVRRDGERLRIRRGLLQRRAATLPLARVHAVRLVEGVLRQPFGLVTVRVETAGYRNEPAAAQTLFPLLPLEEAEALLRRFVPELGGALGPLERPPRRALRRYLAPGAAVTLLPAAALAVLLPAAWPAAVVLPAVGIVHGALRFRAAGWRLADGLLVVRGRRLARSTLIARVALLQEHSVAQSPLQRRARLADVALAVGSGRRGHVAHLESGTARELFGRLSAQVGARSPGT